MTLPAEPSAAAADTVGRRAGAPARAAAPRSERMRRRVPVVLSVAIVVLVVLVLYGPLILLAVFSFNNSDILTLPLRGFTTRWYGDAFADPRMREGLQNSVVIATIITPICLVLGTLTAYALTRMRFVMRGGVAMLIGAALVVPWLVIGISALLFFNDSLPLVGRTELSLKTIGLMHVVCTFPLVAAIVGARLARFDRTQEEAAVDLGATQLQMLRRVVLPHLVPALVASAIFAYMWSFNNFEISYFVGGSDYTFPVWAFSTLRHSQNLPIVNAISTVISAAQVLLVIVAWRVLRPSADDPDAGGLIPMVGR
ncbi:MAG TPA: ABC transporter permease [Gaiellales bacterium]|nr:ABC transporter permease [Gaiellales bacterium]